MNDNPNWKEAPFEESRWDVLAGHHVAREKSRRIEGDWTVIELELIADGKVFGTEQKRLPRVFKPDQHQGEWSQ